MKTMSKRDLRVTYVAVVFLLLLAGMSASGEAAPSNVPALMGVQHTVAADRTRVVLDLSSRVAYEVRSYKNPERVAVNLRGVEASAALPPTEIADGVVKKIRVNKLSWGTQVVFDLRRAATWSDLFLQPVDGMPGRIVVDILGPGASGAAEGAATRSPWVEGPSGKAPDQAAAAGRTWVVAVDAGHGGKHPGTRRGRDLVEKDLVLDIARRVSKSLDNTAGFKAVMTRDRDVFLDLVERTRIAKKKKADIFVSIHLNAAPRKSARGVEVFFISPAGADAAARRLLSNREATARELGIEEPRSADILQILVDLNQQKMMERSFLLAEEIIKAAERPGLPPVRSVKQQSFTVLKSIDMPSVLVEAGFLTNSQDAKIVAGSKGRQAVAEAIAAGIVSFLKKYPPPPEAGPATVARKVHTVQKGETLWAISRMYNTTVASIRRSNGMRESDVLRVGQELVVRENHDGR
jgi:N-acetylmuramoyl-L-alanine amidase